MDDQNTAVRVKGPLLNGEDLNLWVIKRCLDLDGAAIGVVAAENRGKVEEPSLGVLKGERREKNDREGDERDEEGVVEPERKWACVFGWRGGGRRLRGRRVGLRRRFWIGFAVAQ